jgi:hypothetical protein
MHNTLKVAFLSVALAYPAAAVAQAPATAAVVKVGRMLSSSDGHRLGRIDQLDKGPDGTLITAELFSDQGILYVPVSTLSSTNGTSFVTSLTYAQVTKGK